MVALSIQKMLSGTEKGGDTQTQITERTEHAPLDFVHSFFREYPGIFRIEKGKRLCSLHFQNVQ